MSDLTSQLIDQFHRNWQRDRDQRAQQAGENPAFASIDDERRWALERIAAYLSAHNEKAVANGGDLLHPQQEQEITTAVYDRAYGLGRIDQLLRDPSVADVHIFRPDHTMIRRKDGRWARAKFPVAKNNDELIRLVQTAAARGGTIERRWDQLNPELNMQIADGSRLFAIRDVVDHPHVVIRKHDDSLSSLADLIPTGYLTEQAAHFLEKMVQGRANAVVVGATSSGKAHPLDTPIPTPAGWTTVGALQPGDEVFGSNGQPIKLLDLSPVREEPVWTVTFEDGRTVRCSGDHLWEVSSAYSRSQDTPARTAERTERQEAADAHIAQLEARILELAPDLYGTIPQIAEWGGLGSLTPLYRILPEALAVTQRVENAAGGPQPQEVDAPAFWTWLTHGPARTLRGVPLTADLLSASAPQADEWLTARDIAVRLTGEDSYGATGAVRRLVTQSGVAQRPGKRGATTLVVYPAREALHRYLTDLRSRRAGDVPLTTVLSTEELAERVRVADRDNWAVEHVPVLDLPDVDLPVDPYLLGAWLGDGDTSNNGIASATSESCTDANGLTDQQLMRAAFDEHCVTRRDNTVPDHVFRVLGLVSDLRAAGVFGDKHIPGAYLRASRDQRLAVLQGLMDTDGSVDANGCCELTLSHERLATDALELIRTLGIKASMRVGPAGYRDNDGVLVECKDRHRIHFTTRMSVFRLPRKAARLRSEDVQARGHGRVGIVAVERSDEVVPMRCLYVDAPDHLYLTNDFVPTHNTTLLRALCACMPPHEKKVTVEEARELGLDRDTSRHPLTVPMEVKPPDMNGEGGVTAQQLVRMSLRMDPDRIIMGEVRGGEALQMLTAMTQGQRGSMCTMHGESAAVAYPRLALYVKFGDIPMSDEDTARLVADAVHFVIFAAKVPVGDGRSYQRVIDHIIETRGVNGTQVTHNVIMDRSNDDGKNPHHLLRPVMKPSERTMPLLLDAGFDFNYWTTMPQPRAEPGAA